MDHQNPDYTALDKDDLAGLDALIELTHRKEEPPPGYFSVAQYCARCAEVGKKIGERTAREKLDNLAKAGKVDKVKVGFRNYYKVEDD